MSSVTPRRRRRSVEDVDGYESEISVDGETSERARTPKRARPNNDEDEDEDEDEGFHSDKGPVLPDNFRRSPKGKGRAVVPGKHQPGAIVRVKLHDFVTYSQAEFHPGPNLNMIIGPNGTGKSTLVCAIALGLGAKTEVLGRAKDVGEYVKHGTQVAEIEIELQADPEKHARNPVIFTKITRAGNKRDYHVHGKKVPQKELETLLRHFSIQVGNLCQFLPQDRVVEFAALNPKELLIQTQQAAAPEYMLEWHQQLKAMRKEQKEKQNQQQAITEDLKGKEERQRQQEADVTRYQEREEFQNRIAALEKLRPFPEYQMAIKRHKEAKQRMKEAHRELKALEKQVQPNLVAEEDKKAYLDQVEKVVSSRGTLVERMSQQVANLGKKHADAEQKVKECQQELDAELKNVKVIKQNMPRLQQNLRQIENALQNPPEDTDFAALNEQSREKRREITAIENRARELKTQSGSLDQQIQHQENIIERAVHEKAHSQTQAGQQANKLRGFSRNAHEAWNWVQRNRDKFQGDVYGPPIIECSVANPQHAAAVENAIGQSEMTAFTVTTQADFKTLQQSLHGANIEGVSIRAVHQDVAYFRQRQPCTREQLQAYGFENWILDLIEGPEPVLAMLCDNKNISQTAFTSGEPSVAQTNVLKAPDSKIMSWVTRSETYQVTRRREYGDKAASARSQALRPAKIFLEAPGSHHQEDAELERRIADARSAKEEFEGQRAEIQRDSEDLRPERRRLEQEEKAIKDDKARKQTAKTAYDALPIKRDDADRKVKDAQKKIDQSWDKQFAILCRGDEATLKKGQMALDYANGVRALNDLHVAQIEAQINAIEATSDHEQLKARTANEKALLAERQREVQELNNTAADLKQRGIELGEVCRGLGGNFTDLEYTVYEEMKEWDPEQLETEIQSVQARLDMTDGHGNGRSIVNEFEARKVLIAGMRQKLEGLEAKLEELGECIREVKEQWEPQLDELIGKISEGFGENFGKIQCAGEVGVYKDEDFENWAVQIKVKFRFVFTLSPLLLPHSIIAYGLLT